MNRGKWIFVYLLRGVFDKILVMIIHTNWTLSLPPHTQENSFDGGHPSVTPPRGSRLQKVDADNAPFYRGQKLYSSTRWLYMDGKAWVYLIGSGWYCSILIMVWHGFWTTQEATQFSTDADNLKRHSEEHKGCSTRESEERRFSSSKRKKNLVGRKEAHIMHTPILERIGEIPLENYPKSSLTT